MIDINCEQLLTLSQAAKRFPGRNGGNIAVSTLHRWATCGVGGIRLETVVVGGRKMTSAEALQRFVNARTAAPGGDFGRARFPSRTRTSRRRDRGQAAVDKTLRRAGIQN